jgi:toxin ParE1/3/4
MRALNWSQSALDDFETSIVFLAQHDEHAARLVAERIDKAARQLAEKPTGRPGRVFGTYEKSIAKTSYVIAYALSDATVTILRVIHTRQYWPENAWPSSN